MDCISRLIVTWSFLLAVTASSGASFFSNPGQVAGLSSVYWGTSPIGAVWSDDFNRATLGSNWVVLGTTNAMITNNEMQLAETGSNSTRQVYYQPWLTCSDHWTLRWTQRFGALTSSSFGVGVGLKNFQAAGGNDTGYNAILTGAGASLGRIQIQRYNGSTQLILSSGNAMALATNNQLDCSLTRVGWTLTATASNRANAQVSTATFTFNLVSAFTPSISRICLYSLGGTVLLDDISFSLDRRKRSRFIVVGGSGSEGYNASSYDKTYVAVLQSNFVEAVCNDSASYNTITNSVSVLPEILAHQPGMAILMIGGKDLQFGYPTAQWQNGYSNLVAQLRANGAQVRHALNTPRSVVNLLPIRDFILTNYPASEVIDTWTPFVTNSWKLKPVYDSGDGIHPNDAGHLLLGQIIRTNLP
jgi:lysophospholipase L1-like esterase